MAAHANEFHNPGFKRTDGFYNVLDYGAIGNGAADDTTAIQNAITAAVTASGGEVYLPKGTYKITSSVVASASAGIIIKGAGRQTVVQNTAVDAYAFDLRGDNSIIQDLSVFGATGAETGIRVTGEYCTVRNIKATDVLTAVHIKSYDLDASANKSPLRGIVVDNIECDGVNFGLLVEASKDLYFNNIRGSYAQITPKAPHLIYFSDGDGIGSNYNVNGGGCIAYDGTASCAYQFKYVVGGEISRLSARNCVGLLNIMESSNLRIIGITATEDQNADLAYGSIEIDGTNSNIVLQDIYLAISANGKAVRLGSGVSRSKIANIVIQTNHSVAGVTHDVDISGNYNVVDKVQVTNVGETVNAAASIGITNGSYNTISRPKTAGNSRGIRLVVGASNQIKDYDIADIKYDNVGAYSRAIEVAVAAAGTKLFPIVPSLAGIGSQNRLLAYDRGDLAEGSGSAISTTTSGHVWTIVSGTWQSNGTRIFSSVGANSLAYLDLDTVNIDISAGIRLKSAEALTIRATDKDNLIGARVNQTNNKIELTKRAGGTTSVLADAAITAQIGRRYHLRIVAFGDQIDVYLDGTKVISHVLSAADLAAYTATNHGVLSQGDAAGLYDNIEWRSLE
jgi:hypothetical protein